MNLTEKEKELEEYLQQQELREHLEHRDVLLAIGVLIKQKEGLQLFKYLFKSLEVATVPDAGMEDKELHDLLGFLRAGNSIYKLVCEADFTIAASIISELEREKYNGLCERHRLENN